MQLTHTYLDARLAELDAQHAQVLANLNALAGAKQMVQAMKAALDAPEPAAQASQSEAAAPQEEQPGSSA
jgi:uncharacterized coiled-coil protein SlyX